MADGGEVAVARRAFLRASGTVVGALALGAAALPGGATPRGAMAPGARRDPDLTPEAALRMLYDGNARFAQGLSLAPHRDLARLREVAPKQAPFAAFLGCADSRVPIEIVFDQGFGDLFVTRIAGNVADPSIIGSLEFGTLVLGARVLFVLGHTNCGAVAATMKGDAVPGQISTLYQHIRPAVKAAAGNLDTAIAGNVRNQAEVLAESSPVIGALVKEGKLLVAGGVYDLGTGRVTPVAL